MEKNIRSLRNLTFMCLGSGLVLVAFYYFEKFRFGVNHGSNLLSGVSLVLLACCSSVILKILRALDARLTQIEKLNG